MSLEDNKKLVQRYIEEILGKGNLDVIDEVCADNYEFIAPRVEGGPDANVGRDAFKQRVTAFREAFPDISYTIGDVAAEGDSVVTEFTFQATHKKFFDEYPATDKSVTVIGLIVANIADGKIQKSWDGYPNLHPIFEDK